VQAKQKEGEIHYKNNKINFNRIRTLATKASFFLFLEKSFLPKFRFKILHSEFPIQKIFLPINVTTFCPALSPLIYYKFYIPSQTDFYLDIFRFAIVQNLNIFLPSHFL